VGEERTGLWRYHAEPWTLPQGHAFSIEESDHEREPVALVGPHGRLTADVEGVDIARFGASDGLLLVSSQSADRFDVFERAYPNRFVGSFHVGPDDASGIDAVTHTDGLAVHAGDFGPGLSGGLLVVQDDHNPGGTQNFKLVPLAWVLDAIGYPRATPAVAARHDATSDPQRKDAQP
jgi:3-phytase